MRTMSAGEARRALAAMERGSKTPTGVGTWVRRVAVALLILALLTLAWGWAAGWFSTPAQVAEVRAVIHQQIADLDKVATGQVPYGGGPDMRKVFGSMRDLPEDMRDRVRGDIGRHGRRPPSPSAAAVRPSADGTRCGANAVPDRCGRSPPCGGCCDPLPRSRRAGHHPLRARRHPLGRHRLGLPAHPPCRTGRSVRRWVPILPGDVHRRFRGLRKIACVDPAPP